MDRFVGKRIDGRYEIQEIIGVGGMAVVYKAFDNQENRIVAIKILKEEFISNEEFVRRFKNESKAIAMLSHPNIVKVFDVSFGDLIQYIVMEYIEGITLKEYIEKEGSLRWKDAIYFTLQILKALQHAHDKGIVHRDVKPQNIMVLPDGAIKVTDFGIARFARSEQRTITDKAIGSVHYISPEQARGEKTDEKADIYSVGVMLYEMLTGQLPFQAESAVSVAIMQLQREPKLPTEINGSIPLGLEQITMHAMQKNCDRRYQSAAEMLSDLSQFRKDPSLTFEYNYFVDNSPTKFVSEIGETPITPNEKNTDKSGAETEEKNTMIPILSGIAVTLVLAIAILAFLFVPKLFSGTGEEIECPDFVGKSITEIKNNSEYTENFTFKEEWQDNAEYEEGIIFEQSKKPGSKVKKGAKTEITLFISSGHGETKKVPYLIGMIEATAVSKLDEEHFKHESEEVDDDSHPAGVVVKTSPEYGTELPVGSTIKLYISKGKTEEPVDVPDVVGMTKADAEAEIKDAKLVPSVVEEYITAEYEYKPVGTVFRQEPTGGEKKASKGSSVTVYVSKGVKMDVTVTLPSDLNLDTFYLSLWKNGENVKQVQLQKGTKTYTFKDFVSAEKSEKYSVKISAYQNPEKYKEYQEITVNYEKRKVTVDAAKSDYRDLESTSSKTPSTTSTTQTDDEKQDN